MLLPVCTHTWDGPSSGAAPCIWPRWTLCLNTASRTICSMIFPHTQVRLTSLVRAFGWQTGASVLLNKSPVSYTLCLFLVALVLIRTNLPLPVSWLLPTSSLIFSSRAVCLLHRYISGGKGRPLLLFRAEKRPPYPLSCILLESISSGLKASLVSFPYRDLRQCCQSVCITAQYDITLSNLWIPHCLVIFLIQSRHLLKKFIELGTLGILQPTPHSVPWGGLPDAGASHNQSPGQLSLYLWGSHCCSQPCPSTFPTRAGSPWLFSSHPGDSPVAGPSPPTPQLLLSCRTYLHGSWSPWRATTNTTQFVLWLN